MSELRQREPRYTNRKLLNVAHLAPCMLRLGMHSCGQYPSVPCHSDRLEDGKGVGLKSHDDLAVPGCPACHYVFTREHLGKEGYADTLLRAQREYWHWLWINNLIKVAV